MFNQRFNKNSISPENTPYRSVLELEWATFFERNKIAYVYETPVGGFLPDFYLPSFNVFLECKGGYYTEDDILRSFEIAKISKIDQILTINKPDLFSEFDYIHHDTNKITKGVFVKQNGEIKILKSCDDWLPNTLDPESEWKESLTLYKAN